MVTEPNHQKLMIDTSMKPSRNQKQLLFDSSSSDQQSLKSALCSFDSKEDFLAGCFFDVANKRMVEIEEEREKRAKDDFRDADDFPWLCVKRKYEGVTLKHAWQ